ncbi:hypothetical protein [Brumimicrobium aurantiacum]|uniref:hypothetical protein n=1 Tax=Brumimicrobium aurantiacum TaxID=1737063 RepID=UPI00140323DE|nr:hypothetical protein [Brumimicrobium aurantiacum]
MKHLYVLGKKNWKQQLGGKLTGLMMSGVITEASAKPIIEKVLKPSADFIVGRLMG